jgi:hypothetical protein
LARRRIFYSGERAKTGIVQEDVGFFCFSRRIRQNLRTPWTDKMLIKNHLFFVFENIKRQGGSAKQSEYLHEM